MHLAYLFIVVFPRIRFYSVPFVRHSTYVLTYVFDLLTLRVTLSYAIDEETED